MVPEREAYLPALSVPAAKGMLIELPVFLRGAEQQAGFLLVEHSLRQNETVRLVFAQLLIVEWPSRHGRILRELRLPVSYASLFLACACLCACAHVARVILAVRACRVCPDKSEGMPVPLPIRA